MLHINTKRILCIHHFCIVGFIHSVVYSTPLSLWLGGIKCSGNVFGNSFPSNFTFIKCIANANSSTSKKPEFWKTIIKSIEFSLENFLIIILPTIGIVVGQLPNLAQNWIGQFRFNQFRLGRCTEKRHNIRKKQQLVRLKWERKKKERCKQ